jgi:hypothetical protein
MILPTAAGNRGGEPAKHGQPTLRYYRALRGNIAMSGTKMRSRHGTTAVVSAAGLVNSLAFALHL